jgi:Flp pilus assembly protein TadD
MTIKSSRRLSVAACAAALLVGLWSAGAFAFMSSGGSSGNANADEEYRVAKTAIAQYDYQKAIDHLQKVLAMTPDNADALNLMGFSERKLGHRDQSLAYYSKALALKPEHLGANEYLGELYLEMKDVKKAEERLAVLEKACNASCEEYNELKGRIDKFKANPG